MQYILTEEEYKELGPKTRIEKLEKNLQVACSILASKDKYIKCSAVNEFTGTYCDLCEAFITKLCEYKYKRLSK